MSIKAVQSRALRILGLAVCLLPVAAIGQPAPSTSSDPALLARGAYVFHAGGCLECHTDTKNKGPALAGGRPLPTPFGVFYSPNITPDPATGIGRWSAADFERAMRHGVAPDSSNYFPAFPYPSFTKITDEDLAALWAYLQAQPAIRRQNRPHAVGFPFNQRLLVWGWKLMFFRAGRFQPDPARPAEWNRGAYLVSALGHCAECHTPRNALGGLKTDMMFAGSDDGAEGKTVPNITPIAKIGIGGWSQADLADFLASGMTPDGDFTGGLMTSVVEQSTHFLSQEDRMAIAGYLLSLPPIDHQPRKKPS